MLGTSEVVMIVLISKPIFLLLTFIFIALNLRRGEAPPRPALLPGGRRQGGEGGGLLETGEGR